MSKLNSYLLVLKELTDIMTQKQKILGALGVILAIVSAYTQVLGVAILVPIISLMTSPEEAMQDSSIKNIAVMTGYTDYRQVFIFLSIVTIFIYIFKSVFGIFLTWYNTKFSQKVERELSISIMTQYMRRPYDFFLTYGTTQVQRDVMTDPLNVNAAINAIMNILIEMMTIVMIIAYIVMTDWQMALCISLIAALCVAIIYGLLKRMIEEQGMISRKTNSLYNKVFLEAIEGIKEIQVMNKQNYFIRSFYEAALENQKPQIVKNVTAISPVFAIEGLFVSGMMTFVCVKFSIDDGFITALPLLASYAAAAVRMLPSLGRISNNMNTLTFSTPSIHSVYRNLREQGIQVYSSIHNMVDQDSQLLPFEKNIELKKVSYHYNNSGENVINELDLNIIKGQFVGLVGQSGAGKSTLADIILGLHVPQRGDVLSDGKNIYAYPSRWARTIGYVPQSIYLAEGTIRENIAFGVPKEFINDDLVKKAVEQAQLTSFIAGCEKGLNTLVGERGVRISGGQRQRLAIARALYRQPQILVLDEATSALDNETERTVMSAIEHLQGTITIIIIAHRLTTVRNCDVIYAIEHGKAIKRTYAEISS